MSDTPENEQFRTWSGTEVGKYEAALEAISGAIGAYSAVIAREEAKEIPDEQIIEQAEEGQRSCIRRREELDPAAPEQVARVRTEFSQLAEEIRRAAR